MKQRDPKHFITGIFLLLIPALIIMGWIWYKSGIPEWGAAGAVLSYLFLTSLWDLVWERWFRYIKEEEK